jgi:hypothetical protein
MTTSVDLTGRMAKCAYGDTIKPSDPKVLAFFEYRGEGSYDAEHMCKHCPYHEKAHRFFPYYYPGCCPNCNEDALWYLGEPNESDPLSAYEWGCYVCKGVFFPEQLDRGQPKKNPTYVPHEFEPHGPYEYDRFYCGCHGWD